MPAAVPGSGWRQAPTTPKLRVPESARRTVLEEGAGRSRERRVAGRDPQEDPAPGGGLRGWTPPGAGKGTPRVERPQGSASALRWEGGLAGQRPARGHLTCMDAGQPSPFSPQTLF